MIKVIASYIVLMVLSTSIFACDIDCYKSSELGVGISAVHHIITDTSYQSITSDYYGLGETDDSIATYKVDLMSQFKLTENIGLTSTIRALNRTYKTDFYNDYPGVECSNMNMIENKQYTDAHFRSLYLTYNLPEIGDYKHMIAGGTMPFQGGSWSNYKTGLPKEADGLSMMFDMPFDALVYVADISEYTSADFFQVRAGFGEYMKLRSIYPQNENIGRTPYGTTVSFLNLDVKEGDHNIKFDVYSTDWVFKDIEIGTAQQVGVGYAFDRMEEDGYVVYGTVAASRAEGSYMNYVSQELNNNREALIQSTMATYSINYATAATIIDSKLSNVTPEFVASALDINLQDTGLVQGDVATGWAYQLGAKKEFWWVEEFDVEWFVGGEYFRSSKDWVATTLRGFSRKGIDPLLKGQALDLYTGINFDDNKTLTFSVIHEDRKWGPTSVNDVVGIRPDETNRNMLEDRTIFRVDFTWMFLGL